MRIGLGSGSTAAWLSHCLGERIRAEGLRFTAVATSRTMARLARREGIALMAPQDMRQLDLTIDGADEVDAAMTLVKGGGGALLQEKITAAASARMVVIIDRSKQVPVLGAFGLPLEVVPFGWQATRRQITRRLAALGLNGAAALRQHNGQPFVSDEGHYIIDLQPGRIAAPASLDSALKQIPGVIETGLFMDMCDSVVVGHPDGSVRVHNAQRGPETATTHQESNKGENRHGV